MKKFLLVLTIAFVGIMTHSFAFSDVPKEFWAYERINRLYNDGIISGFGDGTFRPRDTITREQVASVVSNFFKLTQNEEAKEFDDVPTGRWSEEYIKLVAQYMELEENDGVYSFKPFENATRIDVAKLVANILGVDDEEIDYTAINKFNDKAKFAEEDKKYVAFIAQKGIMSGDEKSNFRPSDTITRAEFCSIIYNVYSPKDLESSNISPDAVLSINGEEIFEDEFNLYFGLQKKLYESIFQSYEIWNEQIEGKTVYDIVKDETKEEIILDRIKLQKAKELKIELNDAEKEKINSYISSSEGTDICEFYGLTSEELYKLESEARLISKLSDELYNKIDHSKHSHADINSSLLIGTYSARHILLSTQGLSQEESLKVKESAEKLLEQVKDGADFAKLANEYSSDTGSNQNGGLYENVKTGEFVKEFETAALSLEEGEIYPELVKSGYGYHIIKLEKKVIESTRELTEDEKKEIKINDLNEAAQEWLKNSKITLNNTLYNSL